MDPIWHMNLKLLYLTCVYTVVLEILDVIVSKEVFTNLEKKKPK